MTPPDKTPEQVVAEAVRVEFDTFDRGPLVGCEDVDLADVTIAALRAHGIPVGWEDVRERVLTDAAVAEAYSAGQPFYHRDEAREALTAAIDHAEQEAPDA